MLQADVLIIGAGAAGMYAALERHALALRFCLWIAV